MAENALIQVQQGLQLMADQNKLALPPHIPVHKFVRAAHQAIRRTRSIEKCTVASIYDACERAATDGLMLDGREASIVVRKERGVFVAKYEPMYQGLLKLIRQSGAVSNVRARLIHKNDHFKRILGDDERYEHEPVELGEPAGDIVGAYAIATLKDGEIVRDLMDREQLDGIRERSAGWQAFKAKKISDTPWNSDYGEMARKTVLRRLVKYLPKSTDLLDAVYGDGDIPMPSAPIKDDEPAAEETPEDEAPARTPRSTAAAMRDAAPIEDAEVVDDDQVPI